MYKYIDSKKRRKNKIMVFSASALSLIILSGGVVVFGVSGLGKEELQPIVDKELTVLEYNEKWMKENPITDEDKSLYAFRLLKTEVSNFSESPEQIDTFFKNKIVTEQLNKEVLNVEGVGDVIKWDLREFEEGKNKEWQVEVTSDGEVKTEYRFNGITTSTESTLDKYEDYNAALLQRINVFINEWEENQGNIEIKEAGYEYVYTCRSQEGGVVEAKAFINEDRNLVEIYRIVTTDEGEILVDNQIKINTSNN